MAKTIVELNKELFFALERFQILLDHTYSNTKVVYDLVMKRAEIYKHGELIKVFEFKSFEDVGEWAGYEHALWEYLGDLVLELSLERMRDEERIDNTEDIPF